MVSVTVFCNYFCNYFHYRNSTVLLYSYKTAECVSKFMSNDKEKDDDDEEEVVGYEVGHEKEEEEEDPFPAMSVKLFST